MHVSSILYASQHRTDGHVPIELMKAINHGGDDQVRALAEVGMWHLAGHDCPDCPDVSPGQAYVHDYLDHNSSAKDASKATEKARKAAHARWNASSNASSNADRMPKEKRREEKNRGADSSKDEPEEGSRKRRSTQLPKDWRSNDSHASKAKELGVDLTFEEEQFKSHHLAKGSSFRNWDMAFHSWLGKAVKFNPPSKQPPQADLWDRKGPF